MKKFTKISYILRKFEKQDVESLVKNANNFNIAKFLTHEFPYPYTKKDAEIFISSIANENPKKTFAIDIYGEIGGAIAITPKKDIHRKNAEIGYWIAEKYWNKGLATSTIIEVVNYGFKTFDINRIYAKPFGANLASQRALKKSGFKLEAKLEKAIYKNNTFYDELIFSIIK